MSTSPKQDQDLLAVCHQITTEADSRKLNNLTVELIKLLDAGQAEIRREINISRSRSSPARSLRKICAEAITK